ncbi:MAG: GMC family oxidoreductase [Ramlibacter sp.]|nr:GMC family oxidoreductase [Ramlibacter sp.]
MTQTFDVIIVGSGPAGVSAAFPLVEAGLQVLMVDGGLMPEVPPPPGQYLDLRRTDEHQVSWMVGDDFHALRNSAAISPKLRAPGHSHVFEGFASANRIDAHDFIGVGSLARGGLSNAWGCGVARLSAQEMADFPFDASLMDASYEAVSRRIGLSGAAHDDLTDYFGVDAWCDEPITIDDLQSRLLDRYVRRRESIAPTGVRLGRSRIAVLSRDRGTRRACDLSGTCLWGCHRGALYSSLHELDALQRHDNFHLRSGFVVEHVIRDGDCVTIQGGDASGPAQYRARRVLLGAGILASTRLALEAIDHHEPVAMQSSPTAAFLLWLPAALGRAHVPAFGLGQLSFTLALERDVTGFGSLFSTTGIPLAEFSRHMPLARRFGIDVLSNLLSSCVIGNVFLPGYLTNAQVTLDASGALKIEGRHADEVKALMRDAHGRAGRAFRKLGAHILPGSFTVGAPGSDIHYAATLPMRADPRAGETDAFGEVAGAPGLHAIDSASLPSVTEKSHTLTLMANADRIARRVADVLAARR